ncbi:MAG: hypothetical protein F6K40_09305 [Okeania sp. SIO3I5]|nr:hypothetical protein [Okeania sp. SIO3I5]NEQ36460.1 hypothetical protein [Okeania sp. SIO3I5]
MKRLFLPTHREGKFLSSTFGSFNLSSSEKPQTFSLSEAPEKIGGSEDF